MRKSGFIAGLALAALGSLTLVDPSALFSPAYAKTSAAAAHERLLPLEGGRNFRDLGGYPAANGRHVKWGMLYRSGSMHGLTAKDYAYLEKLGIRVVCDFRDSRERRVEPAVWPEARAPKVLFDDYELQSAMPSREAMATMTGEQAQTAFAAMYPGLLKQFNGQYRRMFTQLLAGNAPLAFNCSAGKDRTGIAAALLLTALGVPRETVIEDYLLTNRYLDASKLLAPANQATANMDWAKAANPVMRAFLVADRRYIEAALAVVDAHPGGANGYLKDELGLAPQQLTKLRSLYLK